MSGRNEEHENKKDKKPWDDNLPENKKYIKRFFKKSERQIKKS